MSELEAHVGKSATRRLESAHDQNQNLHRDLRLCKQREVQNSNLYL